MVEEWRALTGFEGPTFSFFPSYAILRPLVFVPYFAAYLVSKDSLVGLNMLFPLIFFTKGMVFYLFFRELVANNPSLSLLATVLFIIYPSDDGLFTFRTFNAHFSVIFFSLPFIST